MSLNIFKEEQKTQQATKSDLGLGLIPNPSLTLTLELLSLEITQNQVPRRTFERL